MCAPVRENIHNMCVDTRGGQKREFRILHLELELQVVMSHLMWPLGIELQSSARAASLLNCSVHLFSPNRDREMGFPVY